MTPPDNNDHELIEMCRAGNELGFAGLYNRYAKSTYNSIHRFVLHTAEAEDIMQETFVGIFRDMLLPINFISQFLAISKDAEGQPSTHEIFLMSNFAIALSKAS